MSNGLVICFTYYSIFILIQLGDWSVAVCENSGLCTVAHQLQKKPCNFQCPPEIVVVLD